MSLVRSSKSYVVPVLASTAKHCVDRGVVQASGVGHSNEYAHSSLSATNSTAVPCAHSRGEIEETNQKIKAGNLKTKLLTTN